MPPSFLALEELLFPLLLPLLLPVATLCCSDCNDSEAVVAAIEEDTAGTDVTVDVVVAATDVAEMSACPCVEDGKDAQFVSLSLI